MSIISEQTLISMEETQKEVKNDLKLKPNTKYSIKKVIKAGDFGSIYLCTDKKGDEKLIKYCAKELYQNEIEFNESHIKTIKDLFSFVVDYQSFNRFNNILDHGEMDIIDNYFIVYEKLGKNLDDVRKSYDNEQVKLFDGLKILIECLSIINYLHNLGYVHRKIKPSSFCYRLTGNENNLPIVLANFEECCKIYDKDNTKHLSRKGAKYKIRNIKYCSVNQHKPNVIYTPADDIESWYYIGVLLFEGQLPWKDINIEEDKKIMEKKQCLHDIKENSFYIKTPDVFRSFIGNILKKTSQIDVNEFVYVMTKIITKYSRCNITDNSLIKYKNKEEKKEEKKKV